MTEYEDPDFRASKYPPNPAEVTYWIDITEDPSGNLIKTYDYTQKKWLYLSWHPLDVEIRRAKAKEHALDLITGKRWKKEIEIVNKLGFVWEGDYSDYKQIELPSVSSNNYFKSGDTLIKIIQTGDTEIKRAIDAETARATNKETALHEEIEQETVNRTTIDTQIQKSVKSLSDQYTALSRQYTTLQSSYTQLLQEVSQLRQQIQAQPTMGDDLGL